MSETALSMIGMELRIMASPRHLVNIGKRKTKMANLGNNDPLGNNNRNRTTTNSPDETTTFGNSDTTGYNNRNRANTPSKSSSSTIIALAIAAAVVIGGLLLLSNDWGPSNSQVSQTGEQGNDAASSTGNAPTPTTPAPTAPATNP
jgi:hypothetical protein